MRSPFKTVAVALVLALTTATLADASTKALAAPSTTSSVAGKASGAPAVNTTAVRSKTTAVESKTTAVESKTVARGKTVAGGRLVDGKPGLRQVSAFGRHRAHLAAFARHRHLAHRPFRTKIVRRVGVTHIAQNHRAVGASSVIR